MNNLQKTQAAEALAAYIAHLELKLNAYQVLLAFAGNRTVLGVDRVELRSRYEDARTEWHMFKGVMSDIEGPHYSMAAPIVWHKEEPGGIGDLVEQAKALRAASERMTSDQAVSLDERLTLFLDDARRDMQSVQSAEAGLRIVEALAPARPSSDAHVPTSIKHKVGFLDTAECLTCGRDIVKRSALMGGAWEHSGYPTPNPGEKWPHKAEPK